MPCARSFGTSALTVAASSRNSRPATPLGLTMVGVPCSVMPMKATFTPLKVLMPAAGSSVRPVAVSKTLAESHLNLAPSNVPGAAEPRPLQLFGSGLPLVILQPPVCRRRSSTAPLSNSWLPTALNSTPILFSVSIAGSSKNRADTSGEAPMKSPAPTTTLSGFCAFSLATCPARNSAPPTGGRGCAAAEVLTPNVPGDSRLP